MGKLQAKATGGLVRATVSVTATTDVVNATGVNTLKATAQYVLPAAQLSYIWIVLDVAVDSIGYNKFVHDLSITSEHVALGLTKPVTDHETVADQAHLGVTKNKTEALATHETRVFSISKALADSVAVTDDFHGTANADDDETMWFSKGLPAELLHPVDLAKLGVGKKVADTAHPTDVRTVGVTKVRTENLGTTEVRTTSFTKSLSDAVDAGDEFNAVASTDDGEVIVFGKRLTDTFTQSDSTSVQAEKGLQDDQVTADQIDTIDFGKRLEDVPVTSEVIGLDNSKALADTFVSGDQVHFGLGLGVADRAHYGDGPNFYNTYAIDYFPADYALEGFPALSFTKGIFDTVHTTDDFFGVANTDDDETMQFGKALGDLVHRADTTTVTYSKALADLFTKSDQMTIASSKALTDSVSKSDFLSKGTGKALADSTSSSELVVRNIGKGLSETANTAEYNSFAISKKLSDVVTTTDDFLGNANADDDETMLFGKTISDSFTKSDLTVKTAGKGLADSASTSESGSIVWTDYWPIGYTDTTSGVYVGTRRTF